MINRNIIDPYNEENWDDDQKEYSDLYIIYVVGQDMNFLSKKIGRFDYKIATMESGVIHFNGYATVTEPYEAQNINDILDGKELVGYIERFNLVRFKTLQSICQLMNISINSINFYM